MKVCFTLFTILAISTLPKKGQCQMGMGGIGMGGMGMGMGGMGMGGMGMAMMGEIPPQDYMVLDSAVKQIVGPNASPNPAIIAIAARQGGVPTTLPQMIEYIPHLQTLAQQHDVKPAGVIGRPTFQQLNDHIMQRANQWMQTNVGFQAMNVDPSLGMATNAMVNTMRPAASQPTATNSASSSSTRNQVSAVAPTGAMNGMGSMGTNGMNGMDGMGGIGLMTLMTLGGFEGLPVGGMGLF